MRHDHESGRTELFAILHVGNGGLGAHLGDACDHGYATRSNFNGMLHHSAFLIWLEALIFTQGTTDDQTGDADVDLRLPMFGTGG